MSCTPVDSGGREKHIQMDHSQEGIPFWSRVIFGYASQWSVTLGRVERPRDYNEVQDPTVHSKINDLHEVG